LSWGRSPAAAAGGWGSSEEAPVSFFGASTSWSFLMRGRMQKEAVLADSQNRL
jgi:hypothetical protein